ncbi:MAG TPA: AAA family ATPase [Pyrinomonadaceae bacterium]|nr:AAA family ATPase [Pyrinomonadaceae bacterium]
MSKNLETSVEAIRSAISEASKNLIERETLVELVALAAVASEHVLIIGAPGTAKSEAVRRIAKATGGNYFEYLLGRFTEPSEIFGPVDLRKLKEGIVETEISGMLPEAEIAFLDEIFLGSTAILNTLLGILNERIFRRGHTRINVPLRVCVGASNALPMDESLAAFADRFLVRLFVEPIADPLLENLLEGGWDLAKKDFSHAAKVEDIDTLSNLVSSVDLSKIRPSIAQAVRILRSAGINISDRRAVKMQRLIASATILDGRMTAEMRDLWTLIYAVPTHEQQSLARDSLHDFLVETENKTLPFAAEDASLGAMARATRLVNIASETLQNPTENEDAWKLKLEGIAREIDAGFNAETIPADLAEIRAKIVEILGTKEKENEAIAGN